MLLATLCVNIAMAVKTAAVVCGDRAGPFKQLRMSRTPSSAPAASRSAGSSHVIVALHQLAQGTRGSIPVVWVFQQNMRQHRLQACAARLLAHLKTDVVEPPSPRRSVAVIHDSDGAHELLPRSSARARESAQAQAAKSITDTHFHQPSP